MGPDKTRYETVIQDRYEAAQTIINGITSARARGIEDAAYLTQIIDETDIDTNTFTRWKVRFAKSLQHSPNLQGTLDDMKTMSIPTRFFNESRPEGDLK